MRLKTECRFEMALRSQCNAGVGFKKIWFPDQTASPFMIFANYSPKFTSTYHVQTP